MSPFPPTPRERDVIVKRACGYTEGEIARIHGISPNTVRTRANRALRKLGARSSVHALGIMLAEGSIRLADLLDQGIRTKEMTP